VLCCVVVLKLEICVDTGELGLYSGLRGGCGVGA
jgi:hypothetical protein